MLKVGSIVITSMALNFAFIAACSLKLGMSAEMDKFYIFIAIPAFWQSLITNACNQIYYNSFKSGSWLQNGLRIASLNLKYFVAFNILSYLFATCLLDHGVNPYKILASDWNSFLLIFVVGILITSVQIINALHMKAQILPDFEVKNLISALPGLIYVLLCKEINEVDAILAYLTRYVVMNLISIGAWNNKIAIEEYTREISNADHLITYAGQTITKSETIFDRIILSSLPQGTVSVYSFSMQVISSLSVLFGKIFIFNNYEKIRQDSYNPKQDILITGAHYRKALVFLILFLTVPVFGTIFVKLSNATMQTSTILAVWLILTSLLAINIVAQYKVAQINFTIGPFFIYKVSIFTFLLFQPLKYYLGMNYGILAFSAALAIHYATDATILSIKQSNQGHKK